MTSLFLVSENSYTFWLAIPMVPLLFYVLKFDAIILSKEIMDVRDWLVMRTVTLSFFLIVGISMITTLLNRPKEWWVVGLLLLTSWWFFRDARVFLRVFIVARTLPNWNTLQVSKRVEIEGRPDY